MSVDIDRMVEETKFSVIEIKVALGLLPECPAKTVEDAKEDYLEETPHDSEEEFAALLKWINLTTTVEEAEEAYNEAEDYDSKGMILIIAFKKWDDLSLDMVEKADTVGEIKNAYDAAPCGGNAEVAAIQKLATFFSKDEE